MFFKLLWFHLWIYFIELVNFYCKNIYYYNIKCNFQTGPSTSFIAGPKMTPQERLKKKMQTLLNKQCMVNLLYFLVPLQRKLLKFNFNYFQDWLRIHDGTSVGFITQLFFFSFIDKADKKAEREKREKEEKERLDREDEMREMSIKLRKR